MFEILKKILKVILLTVLGLFLIAILFTIVTKYLPNAVNETLTK